VLGEGACTYFRTGSSQTFQLAIDALVRPNVLPFWRAVLGYRDRDTGGEDLLDPRGRGPLIWFQEMDKPRPQRNRIRVDVWVPHDQAEARVAAAIEAGGHLVTDQYPRRGGPSPTPRATRPTCARGRATTELFQVTRP
jgi:hypothetical protein